MNLSTHNQSKSLKRHEVNMKAKKNKNYRLMVEIQECKWQSGVKVGKN
jgi:hypothetical protein